MGKTQRGIYALLGADHFACRVSVSSDYSYKLVGIFRLGIMSLITVAIPRLPDRRDLCGVIFRGLFEAVFIFHPLKHLGISD